MLNAQHMAQCQMESALVTRNGRDHFVISQAVLGSLSWTAVGEGSAILPPTCVYVRMVGQEKGVKYQIVLVNLTAMNVVRAVKISTHQYA